MARCYAQVPGSNQDLLRAFGPHVITDTGAERGGHVTVRPAPPSLWALLPPPP
jgi:hypothetical protein